MNKFINFTFVVLGLFYAVLGDETPVKVDIIGQTDKMIDEMPVSKQCSSKLKAEYDSCAEDVKVNMQDFQEQIINATLSNNKDKLTELVAKLSCCPTWKNMDCIFNNIKHCSSDEQGTIQKGLNIAIKELTKVQCTNYAYHSSACGPFTKTSDNGAGSISSHLALVTPFILLISYLLNQN